MSGSEEATDPWSSNAILSALQCDLLNAAAERGDDIDVLELLGQVFRSKQRPAPVVQTLLSSTTITAAHVRAAHAILLQESSQQHDSTTIVMMKRVTTTVWFIQLLFECQTDLTEADANKMAMTLLQNLSKSVQAKLQQQDDSTATTVACFTIGAYLRILNPYMTSRPVFLSPLWKGICDIVHKLPESMPFELAERALQALLVYMKDGQSQAVSTLAQYVNGSAEQQAMMIPIKIIKFFVARCTTLLSTYLKSPRQSNSSTVLGDVATVLLQLRGLTLATTAMIERRRQQDTDRSFLQAYKQLETKVEQCVMNSWLVVGSSRNDWHQLLRVRPPRTASSSVSKQLMYSSCVLGKALVLHRLLERATEKVRDDTQLLLFLCEELLFSTLPLVVSVVVDSSSTLISKCLDTMASATLVCHAHGGTQERVQLDRLLLWWLATSEHPVTRELVVSLIELHIMRLCAARACSTSRDSPRSVDDLSEKQECTPPVLISLLAKVLLDPRSQTTLRRNVAGVVMRFVSDGPTDTSTLPQPVGALMQQAIAKEFEKCIRQDVKTERRKRKHGKPTDEKDRRPLGSYCRQDVVTISQVLRRMSNFNMPSLDGEMASLARDLSNFDASVAHARYSIGCRSRNALSMLLSLLCGVLEESQSTVDSFKQKTGMDLTSFRSSLVKWLVEQQSRAIKSKTRGVRPRESSVIVSCLLFLQSSFQHGGTTSAGVDQLRTVVCLVSGYARSAHQVLQSSPSQRPPEERQCAVSIVFAIASLLANVAGAIPVSCPRDILQEIASTYKLLFDSKVWPIDATCVASLVRFASTIPSAHQSILPECIPADKQGLLQCRLQGRVFRSEGSHTEEMSISVQDDCNKTLLQLIPVLKNRESLFAPCMDDEIEQGSYILTMPTTDGRTAKVIFAPGDDSLQDIKYMLGGTDEDIENVEIRKLQQVRLTGKGHGCLLRSTALDSFSKYFSDVCY